MTDALTLSTENHIAHVEIQTRTMGPDFFDGIGAMFRNLAHDEDTRVVIISSAARAFSYGLDLLQVMQSHGQLFAGGLAAQRAGLYELIRRWQGCFTAVAECPKPVIAAIHGWCIGGGLDLATACDIRLAAADAQISLRETRIAIVADLGSLQRLPAIVGEGHARQMAFTGEDVGADRARQIGLVNEVFADRAALMDGAWALARRIADNPPLVVQGVKDVMGQRERSSVDQGLRYVAAWNSAFLPSADLSEAMAAFMEKRDPRYGGK